MKDCPDALTWQAVLDGEENNPALLEHLAECPACRASYREISAAAGLAGALATEATLPPAVARRILRQAKPFPAGLVAALLFCLLAASAALLQPGGLSWWFSVGMVRMSSLICDGLLGAICCCKAGSGDDPACRVAAGSVGNTCAAQIKGNGG